MVCFPLCFTDLILRVANSEDPTVPTEVGHQPQTLPKESHDCAKKEEDARKTTSTLKRNPACSVKRSSPQALFPHEELNHLWIPPKTHFGKPLLHGLILRHRLKELMLLFAIAVSSNSSSESRPNLPTCRFRRRHGSGRSSPRCARECAPEPDPETPPRCYPRSAARIMPLSAPQCARGCAPEAEPYTQVRSGP